MTPAERLLAAADLLDDRAREATEGPWRALNYSTVSGELRAQVDGNPQEGNYRTADGKGWEEVCRGDADCAGPGPYLMQDDATYIATMHPEVGKAVAALLRWEADAVDFNDGRCALAVADLILAGR